jgi:hypothetical protein
MDILAAIKREERKLEKQLSKEVVPKRLDDMISCNPIRDWRG